MNLSTMYGNVVFQLSIYRCYTSRGSTLTPYQSKSTPISVNHNKLQFRLRIYTIQICDKHRRNKVGSTASKHVFNNISCLEARIFVIAPLIFAIQYSSFLYKYHHPIQKYSCHEYFNRYRILILLENIFLEPNLNPQLQELHRNTLALLELKVRTRLVMKIMLLQIISSIQSTKLY
ncbi:Hypothetical_protein [Hexamita inflata]|uniref:Hypothetical_protein n=1 Tax=Hexamita inflata TaxID=28002 RepID=A0ABP1I8T9_9EUKA